MKRSSSLKFLAILLISSLVIFTGSSLLAPQAKADEATFGLVRFDRMKANNAVAFGATVCLQPSADDASVTTIAVSFSNGNGATTGFILSGTDTDFDATVTDLPAFGAYPGTTATAFPGIDGETPVIGGPNSHTLTYTVASTSLDSDLVYCFNVGPGLTTRANAASDLTGNITTNGTPGETAVYATATISEDQITVTATVPQIFNFSLPDTSVSLSPLSTSSVTSDNVTATIGTNAKAGWVSWVSNTTNGLWSTSQGVGIAVPAGSYGTVYDILNDTTGYVLDVDTGSGAPDIDDAYNGTTVNEGGIMEDTFHQIAYKGTPGDDDSYTLNFRARVTAIQLPSADYTDTVTIAAAGEF